MNASTLALLISKRNYDKAESAAEKNNIANNFFRQHAADLIADIKEGSHESWIIQQLSEHYEPDIPLRHKSRAHIVHD